MNTPDIVSLIGAITALIIAVGGVITALIKLRNTNATVKQIAANFTGNSTPVSTDKPAAPK